jgi:hypothetical protein
MTEVFRAKEPFSFTGHGGVPRIFTPHGENSLISSDDPDYKGREHLFELAMASANRASETASAAPGERRSRGRIRSDAAADGPEKQSEQPAPQSPAAGDKS